MRHSDYIVCNVHAVVLGFVAESGKCFAAVVDEDVDGCGRCRLELKRVYQD